ncbi:hypothetical protein D3C72_2160600 [compost metagenome]
MVSKITGAFRIARVAEADTSGMSKVDSNSQTTNPSTPNPTRRGNSDNNFDRSSAMFDSPDRPTAFQPGNSRPGCENTFGRVSKT